MISFVVHANTFYLHFERKESLDSFQWSQIRLPVNKGGLGILQAINTHHAAHIGSTIDCLEDMKSSPNSTKWIYP